MRRHSQGGRNARAPRGERVAHARPVWWARLALLALAASVLAPLVAAGFESLLWAAAGVAALGLTGVGVWWTLAHTGPVRAAGLALAVAAPVVLLVLYTAQGLLWPAALCLALWAPALAAGRTALALAAGDDPAPGRQEAAPPPRRPWIVMNPRSGGGKAERFGLVEKARAAGATVVLLDPEERQDVAALARRAVADGADLLAVAGGDGTQALVAEVAAEHDLPFVVVPAGTRNHFALDLGLDRDDPAAALDALHDGVELRVDLGYAADRVFVNNASFGTYAAVVRDPAYRDDKVRTLLRTLPELLTGAHVPRLGMRAGQERADGLQALLISNNPYRRAVDAARPGRRERLDSGLLGVLCLRVDNTVRAAGAVRGPRSSALRRLTAKEVVVEAGTPAVPAGLDGEPVVLMAPVVCRSAPGALRVRVPRHRPGVPARGSAVDWREVARLAMGRREVARPAVGPHRRPGPG